MVNVVRNLPASLRHDLRAQVGVIVDCCELLLMDSAPPGFHKDLTKVEAAARRLLALVDDLFEADSAGEVVDHETVRSRLRHELRTPLNHIIGYAEMLLDEAEGGPAASHAADLRKIQHAGRRLTELVEQALHALNGEGAREEAPAAAEPAEGQVVPLSGRVLVVDDDEVNRDVLSRRLAAQGAEVSVAASGREALDILRSEAFDAVLLDVMMPEMSGYEVLHEMKADTSLRGIPVIMISALDEVESAVRCIRLGAEDYLAKPFDPTLLRARLGACIDKKRLHDREIVHLRTIDEERRRSEGLLHAIFPPEIARELKATKAVRPRRYEKVAVMFTDVVGFTRFAETLDPEHVVTDLQKLVEQQERLAESHGLEKIKTIGDGFMAAAGMLRPMPDPVLACLKCGLDMIAAARGLDPPWDLRIGIHVGPVVGGVLGHRQYLFDVIGDTVNTASRIEGAGASGAVSLSGSAWEQIAHLSVGRSLGLVPVAGRSDVEIVRFERFL